MKLPPPEFILLFVNWFGLLFGSCILFYYALRLIKGGTVNILKVAFVCAVVAWCIVCLVVPTTN